MTTLAVTVEEVGGLGRVRLALADLAELPPYEEAPDLYRDWGEDRDFNVKVGKGECAA